MSNQANNPFSRYRTEQMGDTSWKYYVSPEENLLSEIPLVFEGSRGTGKTMFMLCNSWREKFAEYLESKYDLSELLSKDAIIGFYYKIDGRFVGNNLKGKGIEDDKWVSIFNTYFNIIISKEIYAFLKNCITHNIIQKNILSQLNSRVAKKLNIFLTEEPINQIEEQFDQILDQIEEFTNDPEQNLPLLLSSGTLIKIIIEQIKKIEPFSESRFHVLIDEYEELSENQQIQINTLIKQSNYWLVYDICVKTAGIKTYKTISGNEIIQEPHDFRWYRPELKDFDNHTKYLDFLKSICRKRLNSCLPKEAQKVEIYSNIDFYLKKYDNSIVNKTYRNSDKYQEKVKNELIELIKLDPTSEKLNIKDIQTTIFSESPLIERMHIALLRRKDISVSRLFFEIDSNSAQYKEWKRNTEFATHFLLCRELGLDYQYNGLKLFAQLSSGVIRYFIEICKTAFDNAIGNGFSFSEIRPLTIKEQTDAVFFVSESKVAKIDGFVPGGKVLKRLILSLGKIFYLIQTNSETTLGEPEVNHFTTSLFEMKTSYLEISRYLDYAVMHNILQTSLPTKTKSNEIVEIADYHLNHIYCPYFKISHRRKRKITIQPSTLQTLIIGTTEEVNRIVKKFEGKVEEQSSQGKLF